ncbi:MAG: diaminopimelate epimerase [Woeseiaceae bacterium]
MRIPFLKMHGLGNDMMVIDQRHLAEREKPALTEALVRTWSDRKTGIGFDQLMVIDPPASEDLTASYRIFNADGGPVEQCGNGVRCVAAAIQASEHPETKEKLRLGSPAGLITAEVANDGAVAVDMGVPDFTPAALPMLQSATQPMYDFVIDGDIIRAAAVSVGNPHVVVHTDNVATADVAGLGAAMGKSHYFPQGVNVGFAEVVDRTHVRLRVFERGVGETRACGTGACAAMVCLRHNNIVDETVEIALPGGSLMINWRAIDAPVLMTGPASFAYEGFVFV